MQASGCRTTQRWLTSATVISATTASWIAPPNQSSAPEISLTSSTSGYEASAGLKSRYCFHVLRVPKLGEFSEREFVLIVGEERERTAQRCAHRT